MASRYFREVAERLKMGQSVDPEGFDSVTVFFSDVVQFTILAAKCTPFQVVNLLNELYSSFDTLIEQHGVYKLLAIWSAVPLDESFCRMLRVEESIVQSIFHDSSLKQSFLLNPSETAIFAYRGLPARNGHRHVKEIVEMSISFMDYVEQFKVVPFPKGEDSIEDWSQQCCQCSEFIGSCVAGVVGLSMPRYCLFGDTVNTASRMESNGKPGKIHVSESTFTMLQQHYYGEFILESRGEIIIKGKRRDENILVEWTKIAHTSRAQGSPRRKK
ncbi:adenylate/guanylate cyclase catalytic domain protein [Ostertagia ostertagi]